MINVVVDTNIIISAALSPKGNPAKIIEFIADHEEIQIFYSSKIFDEYEKVLSYKRLNIDNDMKMRTLNLFKKIGILIEPVISNIPMPDETDRIFYDTAQTSKSILITGNIKHFPANPFIMTPADFINKVASSYFL